MSIVIPLLHIEDIGNIANNVLNEYQPGGGIPVEIEEIIEFGLDIEIRPVKALRSRFGFEGALSHNLQIIEVDEECMSQYLNRYRFTLAHELGHRIIHGDIIQSICYENKQDWKNAVINALDPKSYGRLEHQAYVFAGYILVPTTPLIASCQEASEHATRHGIDLTEMGQSAISYVAGSIAKEYKVSTAVMERRITAESIFV